MNIKQKKGLFVLRFGLGLFFVLWGLDKIFVPESTVGIFKFFYSIPITINMALGVGIIETLFGLLFMWGMFKNQTYFLGMVLHGISTFSSWRQYLDPFGKNHLFLAAIPVLAGYIALYLMREEDTYCTLT